MKDRIWAYYLLIAISVFGIFVGGLLTWHHETQLYGTDQDKGELIGCVESAQVNCDIVNTSAWSELGGVPIGTWAIVAYLGVGCLGIGGAMGRRSVLLPLWIAGGIAVLSSVFLFYISKVELGYVCAWCLRLYAANFGILIAAVLAGRPEKKFDLPSLMPLVATWGALATLPVITQIAYRSSLLGDGVAVLEEAPAVSYERDPQGPAPVRTFTILTEEKREVSLTLEANDAWKGNPEAKVVVVEFADFECGYCKRMSSEMARLYKAYGDRVLFVFKHYPMNPSCNPGVKNNKHRDACRAASAAVCAQDQGFFWAYHDLVFKNQHQLGVDYLKTYATNVGLDLGQFEACLAENSAMERVTADATAGAALDIRGTPRVYINGTLYRSGTSAEAMARAIEAAIGDPALESRAASLHDNEQAIAPVAENGPEMVEVRRGGLQFAIDRFEASLSGGKAIIGKHQIPALHTSWHQAKEACEASGKRLCTEEEWVTACQGARAIDENGNGEFADDMIEGTAYPYGDYHDKRRCWDGKEGERADGPWRPVYTGEMPGCISVDGAYDLTGNVEEWVGSTEAGAALLGGAWDTAEDHAKCYRRNDTFGAGFSGPRTGFRCCKSL